MSKAIFYFFAILLWVPLFGLLYLSAIHQWSFPKLWGHSLFTFQHWKHIFGSEHQILEALQVSLVLGFFQMSITNIAGFLTSKFIMFHSKASILLSFSYYPFLITPLIFSFLLLYFFMQFNIAGSLFGVALVQFLLFYPFSVLLHASFWSKELKQLLFQATTLGATSYQVLIRLLLPMARPQLILGALICFLLSWFEYAVVHTIGMAKINTLTINTMIYFKEANPHLGAISALFLLLPYLFIILYFPKKSFQ